MRTVTLLSSWLDRLMSRPAEQQQPRARRRVGPADCISVRGAYMIGYVNRSLIATSVNAVSYDSTCRRYSDGGLEPSQGEP